jgi:glyoxylase-like metal-dependent hydrolase (beta-lactamase superfamily II)
LSSRDYTLAKIAPGVAAWVAPDGGWGQGNAALITGHQASLLVDTLWDLPRTAGMLAAFQATLASAPIAEVVNTHSDGDHWFGNQLTGADRIVATETAARSMRHHGPGQMRALGAVSRLFRLMGGDWRTAGDYFAAMLRPFDFSNIRPVLPTATFSGELQLAVGGRPVELIEVGPAHTAGDLVVYLPEERVLFAGDILFFGTVPVLWDGSAENWIRACQRILEWKVDVVLPGHGPVTDLAGIDAVRQYWQFLDSAARRHFEQGDPAPLAARRILGSDQYLRQPFAQWAGQERIVINVHSIYRKLAGKGGAMGTVERVNVLRKTALLAHHRQIAASPPNPPRHAIC